MVGPDRGNRKKSQTGEHEQRERQTTVISRRWQSDSEKVTEKFRGDRVISRRWQSDFEKVAE